jgi:hypothetical protein
MLSVRDDFADVSPRGFAVAVRAAHCLAIEDAVGCCAQVLAGQVWITAEGDPRDTIAGAGTVVPLEAGVRFNLSAFRGVATVLITAPRHLHDVGYSLQKRNGMRVLTIAPGSRRLFAALSDHVGAIVAWATRNLAAPSSTL